MTTADSAPPLQKIFHPTDFSAASHTALIHALKLAVAAKAELSIMHVDPEVLRSNFEDFPRLRPILEEWGLVPPGSSKQQVLQLGLSVKKMRAAAKNPIDGILDYLSTHPADLVVMATHQYEGLVRLQQAAVAEPVARRSRTATLFIPPDVEGFVAPKTGNTRLEKVLVPVSPTPSPQPAVDMATQLASILGCQSLTGFLVHVGNQPAFHEIRYPSHNGWLWHTTTSQGNVVDVILEMGTDFDVDLIVMTTEGHDSLWDMLQGSTMERVLRGARCPLLALPA